MTLQSAPPQLAYTVRTAARMLDVSPQHVRDLVKAGTLRRVEGCGRNWAIVAADVHALAGGDTPSHEALSSRHERDDLVRELRRLGMEALALAERWEQSGG